MLYFAWVNPGETTFTGAMAREDEKVLGFDISHAEGGFAEAQIEIRNPRIGLLNAGRKIWAWLAWSGDPASTGGPEPLFFGRLVGVPADLQGETIRLSFIARPRTYRSQKRTVAEALKVAPYWDPVWIPKERRSDPDAILEARSALWHVDRISHAVSLSDITAGEDGTVALGTGEIIAGSLSMTYGEPPLRTVTVTAEVLWNQKARGNVDITKELVAAFRAVGTVEPYLISSYTGQGLGDDWPERRENIGGGWSVLENRLKRADRVLVPASYKTVWVKRLTSGGGIDDAKSDPIKILFPLWRFLPTLSVRYDADRPRSETLTFEIDADVQALVTDAGEEEELALDFSSAEIGKLVDSEGSAAARPIQDLRRRQYFTTDRGAQSIEYLIAVARARLMARARAVEISIDVPFAVATQLSCRKSAAITDARLPGGSATGKIVHYGFRCNGDTGEMLGTVTIACTIGKGSSVTASPGTPKYADSGYADTGYQQYASQQVAPITSEIAYTKPTDPPADDGVDFFNMRADTVIDSFAVTGGVTEQAAALNDLFDDISSAVEALNEHFTEVDLVLVPVTGGPFEYNYIVACSALMVPRTINLEAGG